MQKSVGFFQVDPSTDQIVTLSDVQAVQVHRLNSNTYSIICIKVTRGCASVQV